MIFAKGITGAGYMAQFTRAEETLTRAAMALYVSACESDMSADRLPAEDMDTARKLEAKSRRGFFPTLYTGAEIVVLYSAVSFWLDAVADFPEYMPAEFIDADAARKAAAGIADTIRAAALAEPVRAEVV